MCLCAAYCAVIRGLSETKEGKMDMPRKMVMEIFLALVLPMTLYNRITSQTHFLTKTLFLNGAFKNTSF